MFKKKRDRERNRNKLKDKQINEGNEIYKDMKE
jgi:hypothetical protein